MATSDKSSNSPYQDKHSSISYHDTDNVMEDASEESKDGQLIKVPTNEFFQPKFFPPHSTGKPLQVEDIELAEKPQSTHNEMIAHLEKLIHENREGNARRKEEEKLQRYLFKIPPDFEEAKRHGKAMKVRVSRRDLEGGEDKQ